MIGQFLGRRAILSDLDTIERRLRALERDFQHFGGRIPARAAEFPSRVGDAVAAALTGLADRFRESRDDVGKLGPEAIRLGHDALRRVSHEIERRPLVTLGVALGVGILLGLLSARRWNGY